MICTRCVEPFEHEPIRRTGTRFDQSTVELLFCGDDCLGRFMDGWEAMRMVSKLDEDARR